MAAAGTPARSRSQRRGIVLVQIGHVKTNYMLHEKVHHRSKVVKKFTTEARVVKKFTTTAQKAEAQFATTCRYRV